MFKREHRYVVLKNTDIGNFLTQTEKNILAQICDKIHAERLKVGKRPLQSVVVESDWPEYETVWEMIADRMADIITVDMSGKDCACCNRGTYQETEIQDDMNGELHCNECGYATKRYVTVSV
jgi:hypothetical protein